MGKRFSAPLRPGGAARGAVDAPGYVTYAACIARQPACHRRPHRGSRRPRLASAAMCATTLIN